MKTRRRAPKSSPVSDTPPAAAPGAGNDVPCAGLERAFAEAVGDRAQLQAGLELAQCLMWSDLARTGALVDALMPVAERVDDDELSATVYWMRGVFERDRAIGDAGAAAFDRSYELALRSGDHDGCARALLHRSRIADRRGDYRAALAVLEPCLAASGRLSARSQAQLFARVAGNYVNLGEYAEAHAYAVRAMEAADVSGDRADRVNAYAVASGIYFSMGMYSKARTLMTRSIECADDPFGTIGQLSNLGSLAAVEGDYEAALEHLGEAFRRARDRRSPHDEAVALSNRASTFQRMGRHRDAIRDAKALLALAEPLGRQLEVGTALGTLGQAYAALGNLEPAFEELTRALAIFEEIGRRRGICLVHRDLADVCRRLGRTEDALDHLRAYTDLHDEIFSPTAMGAMADVLYALEGRRAEQEREILRLRAAQLEQEAEYHDGRLTAVALQLVEKREFLQSLDTRLRAAGAGSPEGAAEIVHALARDVRQNLSAEAEWQTFEEQFGRVHGTFLAQLEQRHPDLSAAELKICALTRINLDTKEVARLLGSSVRTVQNHRYNIRRKLGLRDRESLSERLRRDLRS